MSTFRRLLGTAQKALDAKSSGSSRSGQGSDWRSLVRSAADQLTGDTTSSSTPHRTDRHGPRADHGSTGPSDRFAQEPHGTAAQPAPPRRGTSSQDAPADLTAEDRRAIARYDYLVRTAEPEQLERVHREAFETLTPRQRTQLTATMRSELPEGEQPRTEAPQDLARSATRLGALDPRRLTGLLGRAGGGRGLGTAAKGAGAVGAGVVGAGAVGGLLAAVAGGAVVSSVGGSLLEQAVGDGIDVDALTPDLAGDLGELGDLGGVTGALEAVEPIEGMEGLGGLDHTEGMDGLDSVTQGLGDGVSGAGDRLAGLGDQLSDLGLGDLFRR